MKKQFQDRHSDCVYAAALGIARNCIWSHACQRCAFDQWLDDTGPADPQNDFAPDEEFKIRLSNAA